MTGKAKPGGRRKRIVGVATPEFDQQRIEEANEESKPDPNPKAMQAVVRVVEDANFVHFYLACGHLVTIKKTDLKGMLPNEKECWACASTRS